MTEAYPLRWPDGWQKTTRDKRGDGSKFRRGGSSIYGYLPSFDGGLWSITNELKQLGAHSVVVSANVRRKQDGSVHPQNPARFDDPGVALYFVLNNKPMVMAQDAYDTPGCNLRSLTMAIEAMRSLERHGGRAMMTRGFDGFAALPPPEGSTPRKPWWEVLRYPADPTEREFLSVREIEIRTEMLAKKAHPDQGGSHAAMAELNAAKLDAITELSKTDEPE